MIIQRLLAELGVYVGSEELDLEKNLYHSVTWSHFLTFFSFSAESWGGEERMAWPPRADSAVAPVLISVSSHRERLGRPADDICGDEICAH